MSLQDRLHRQFQDAAEASQQAAETLVPAIAQAAEAMLACLTQGNKVLACGNGDGAAAAQYFAALMLNRLEHERPGLAALALSADSVVMTAIADESAFELGFARQVRTLGQPGDLLLVISGNGQSPNLLRAVDAAHANNLTVLALTGGRGDPLAEQLEPGDVLIQVPSGHTPRICEIHLLSLHCLCDAVDSVLLGVD